MTDDTIIKKRAQLREELQQAVDSQLGKWLDMVASGGFDYIEMEEGMMLLVAQLRLIEMRLWGVEASLDSMAPTQ